VRRGTVVALAATLSLAALGAHWIAGDRDAAAQDPRGPMTVAQSAPTVVQSAPTVVQSAPTVVQSAPTVAQSAPTVAQSAPTKDEVGDEVQTVPRGQLPPFAGEGDTGALYRFATTRGDVLRWMPCTCGCAQIGHTSNRSCYIKSETETSVTYTSHAAT
jgi:hypothetical protein